MKRLLSLSLILIIIISLVGNVYAVNICEVSLQADKNQVNKDSEFVVDIKLSNIQDSKGIFGISAILEYDKDSLEYKGMESQDGWEKPSYYEESGVVAILREGEYATTDQTICKITFKVKNTSKKDIRVTLRDIVASNGTDESKIGEKNADIYVIDGSGTPVLPLPTDPTNTNPEGNRENTSVPGANAGQNIPYAGNDNTPLVLVISGFILLAVASFIKVKFIDKD